MSTATLHEPHVHVDATGAKIAMWLFLFTELLLFGGLFLAYAVFRTYYPADFHYATTTLSVSIGALNTAILLTSSLTMVLSVAAMERLNRRLSVILLGATAVLGIGFLINKYFEWSAKFHHGLYPGSQELGLHPDGEKVFYGLYFTMTGLHGVHVLVGVGVLVVILVMIARRPRRTVSVPLASPTTLTLQGDGGTLWNQAADAQLDAVDVTLVYRENEAVAHRQLIKLENAGLYWHLVDVIWIFLFPLLYLIS